MSNIGSVNNNNQKYTEPTTGLPSDSAPKAARKVKVTSQNLSTMDHIIKFLQDKIGNFFNKLFSPQSHSTSESLKKPNASQTRPESLKKTDQRVSVAVAAPPVALTPAKLQAETSEEIINEETPEEKKLREDKEDFAKLDNQGEKWIHKEAQAFKEGTRLKLEALTTKEAAQESLIDIFDADHKIFESFGTRIVTQSEKGEWVDMEALLKKAGVHTLQDAKKLGIEEDTFKAYQEIADSIKRRPSGEYDLDLSALQAKYHGNEPRSLLMEVYRGLEFEKKEGVVFAYKVDENGERVNDKSYKMSELLRDSGLSTDEIRELPILRDARAFCKENNIDPMTLARTSTPPQIQTP